MTEHISSSMIYSEPQTITSDEGTLATYFVDEFTSGSGSSEPDEGLPIIP